MLKYPIVVSDNIIPLIYDRQFKSFASIYSKELVDYIIDLCKLNIECNNYNLINNEITTFYEDDKLMVTDLLYKLNDSTFLNIELNTSKSKYLMYKNLLYIYKIILNEQNKGKKYKDIIVIQVNFDLYSFKDMDKVKNVIKVINKDNLKEYLNTFTIFHFELDKAWNNEYNVSEEGIRFLRMLSSRSKRLNQLLAGDNLFLKKVAKFMEDYSNNSDNLLYYDKKELDDYIRESELNDSYNDGLTEGKILGLSEGMSKGKRENSIEIARKMLNKDRPIEEISEITGLTKEEILKLKDN